MKHSPMMKCGHAAQGTCSSSKGVKYDPPIPVCVICSCAEIDESAPDLSDRRARCSYYKSCKSEAPSDHDRLAFFEYHGPGSKTDTETCKCGKRRQLHYPRWQAVYKQVRRWYKHERLEEERTMEAHWPDEASAKLWAEAYVETLLHWTNNPETKVHSVELLEVRQIPSPVKCREFITHGPADFDEYYCGCHGWN